MTIKTLQFQYYVSKFLTFPVGAVYEEVCGWSSVHISNLLHCSTVLKLYSNTTSNHSEELKFLVVFFFFSNYILDVGPQLHVNNMKPTKN